MKRTWVKVVVGVGIGIAALITLVIIGTTVLVKDFKQGQDQDNSIVMAAAKSVNPGSDFQYQGVDCGDASFTRYCTASYTAVGSDEDLRQKVKTALEGQGYQFTSEGDQSTLYDAVSADNTVALRSVYITPVTDATDSQTMKVNLSFEAVHDYSK